MRKQIRSKCGESLFPALQPYPSTRGRDSGYGREKGTMSRDLRTDRFDIFDQQHVVAMFAVNEFVDQFFSQQKPEAAWPQTLRFANGKVTEGIAGRTVDGRVAEFFQRETLTRVLDPAYNRSPHADERNFHILARVEVPTMLHGVDENFAESSSNSFPVRFGNAGVFEPMEELDQAICGGQVAARRQAHPSGCASKDFNTVIPARRCHSCAHHGGEFASLERGGEITESSLAHGSNHISGNPFIREDNHPSVRTRTSDFTKEFNIL